MLLLGAKAGLGPAPDLGHAESPIFVGASEKIRIMALRSITDEFRRRAVDLYEPTPGATALQDDPVDHLPGVPHRLTATTLRRLDQPLDHSPLSIGQHTKTRHRPSNPHKDPR